MEQTDDGFWVDEDGQKYVFRPQEAEENGVDETNPGDDSEDSSILWTGPAV